MFHCTWWTRLMAPLLSYIKKSFQYWPLQDKPNLTPFLTQYFDRYATLWCGSLSKCWVLILCRWRCRTGRSRRTLSCPSCRCSCREGEASPYGRNLMHQDLWNHYQVVHHLFLKNGPFPASFSLFLSFQYSWQQTKNVRCKRLPMTGFKPRTSDVGSNRSTNWATTTAPFFYF